MRSLPTTRFATATGSVYEIDRAGSRIRRAHGLHDPTPYQGDGGWQEFLLCSEPVVGKPVLTVWKRPGKTPGTVATTESSPVVQVWETTAKYWASVHS